MTMYDSMIMVRSRQASKLYYSKCM